ncbi:hypothetical protein QMZ05_27610 [Bradyrhizobium sp. INPA03-11B]|uniref:hypothetical protein n=1 Tax=Bradyrhizobium sp. INPA03-11B TaxID=418598 RepID=UPI00338F1CC9
MRDTATALVCSDQRVPSAQMPLRGFGGVSSAAAAALEMPAAIVISVVATNLFTMCMIIVSGCRCQIVRNAE